MSDTSFGDALGGFGTGLTPPADVGPAPPAGAPVPMPRARPEEAGPGANVLDARAEVPQAAPTSEQPLAVTQAPPPKQEFGLAGKFGEALKTWLPPQYQTDPNAPALDTAEVITTERIDRAKKIMSNPAAQFFYPDQVKEAREALMSSTKDLLALQQVKQQQTDIQKTATNFGMPKSMLNPMMTNDTVDNWLLEQYKAGDLSKAQALKARGKAEWATDFMPQAIDAAGQRWDETNNAVTTLSAANGRQDAYQAALSKLTPEDREVLTKELAKVGVTAIPDSAKAWQGIVQQHGAQFATTKQMLSQAQRRLNNLNNFDGTVPKETETSLQGDFRLGSTGISATLPVRTRGMDGQIGHVGPNGAVITENYGKPTREKGWGVVSEAKVKTLREDYLGTELSKGVLNQYTMMADLYDTLTDPTSYTSTAGRTMVADKMGTLRNAAEKAAASGNIGFSRLFHEEQGTVEGFFNRLEKETSAFRQWMAGGKKGAAPTMTPQTIRGLQEVAAHVKEYAKRQASERLADGTKFAGTIGMPLEDVPIPAELRSDPRIADAHEEGRIDAINGFNSRPSIVRGNQRIWFDQNADVEGASPPRGAYTVMRQQDMKPPGTGGVGSDAVAAPGQPPVQPRPPVQPPVQPPVPPGTTTGTAPGSPPPPTPTGTAVRPPSPQAPLPPGGGGQAMPLPPGGGGQAMPPTDGLTPGRSGLPPGMTLETPEGRTALTNRMMQLESGFKPGQQTGSYKGLLQWSKSEMERHGITDPDSMEQNREASDKDITRRVSMLKKDGLPVTAANVYLMHQQGETGLKAHLNNPDGKAWENMRPYFKSEAVAKQAVWGNMTPEMRRQFPGGVDTVTSGDFTRLWDARVNGTDNTGKADVASAAGRRTGMSGQNREAPRAEPGAAEEKPGLMARVAGMFTRDDGKPSNPMSRLAQGTPEERRAALNEGYDTAVEHAPAIASTAGSVVGAAAGPFGAVGGGAAGGAGGQAFKDWMQGREQNPREIAKQGVLGAVLGVASEARPLLAAATRVVGVGGIEAADTALKGGDLVDAAGSAVTGGAFALGGEALGRFVSAGGAAAYKALSRYTTKSQAELSAHAGELAAARETLKTEQPTLPAVGDKPGAVNPKYEAAKAAEDKATKAIKDHGQNPDDMVHAYTQAKEGVSAGEAATMRKAAAEETKASQGYNQLREDAAAAGGAQQVKANQPVPDGPLAQIRTPENPTAKVQEVFRPDAEHAELLVRAQAKNWGEKWGQLQEAGTELIKKRMNFLRDGDTVSAKAMDDIFKGVRNQQKAAAKYLFGDKRGAEVIQHLEGLDRSYATVMKATAGMDYQKMQAIIQKGNTPERRELEASFKKFAADDPAALRAFNAMKAGAQGRAGEEAKLMVPIIMGEFAANAHGIPTVGLISAAVGGHRMVELMKQYMNAKLLGRAVTFKDFLMPAVEAEMGRRATNTTVRNVAQRGALQRTSAEPEQPQQ